MAAITYFTAIPAEGFHAQITMLATGDDERDVEDIMAETRRAGWNGGALVGKWISDTRRGERDADGKNKFRGHVREWVKAL